MPPLPSQSQESLVIYLATSDDHFPLSGVYPSEPTSLRKNCWLSPIFEQPFISALKSRGIQFTDCENKADVSFFIERPDLPSKLPTIHYIPVDQTVTPGIIRRCMQQETAQAILRPVMYTASSFEDFSHHDNVLWDLPLEDRVPYDVERLYPQLEHHKQKVLNHIPWSSQFPFFDFGKESNEARPIDIMFLGSHKHYWCGSPRSHRTKAIEALHQLPRDVITLIGSGTDNTNPRTSTTGRLFPNSHEHYHLLKQTKIVLSPWGYSEISTRDYEALFAGCILIKPKIFDTPHWKSFPDPNESAIFCNSLFSDLEEQVSKVLSKYHDIYQPYAASVQKAYHAIRDNKSYLPDYYSSVFRAAANAQPIPSPS